MAPSRLVVEVCPLVVRHPRGVPTRFDEVIRDSATVLLEGTPPGTDMPAVIAAAIKAASGGLDVHDLHV